MRLVSHVWVSAFLRAETGAGAYAVVVRKGAPEAGAIFVCHDHLDGYCSLYAPAPQALVEEGQSQRIFELVEGVTDRQAMLDYLERQIRFDPDCWILETERKSGVPLLIDTPDG
ncbi:MAG: DUF1491 family protein [Rhizobiaceae bacterium]